MASTTNQRSVSPAGSSVTMTDKSTLVTHPTFPWWDEESERPPFYPRDRDIKTACGRHCPLFALMFFILLNAGDYPLIYLDDIDPLEWHFILFYSALLTALLCCVALGVVDPGIRRPNMHGALREGNTDWVVQHFGPAPQGADEDVKELMDEEYHFGQIAPKKEIDGVQYKWCYTCKLWRPPGTVHCSECGFCIDLYDHHCGVIGHCVAKNNIRFFGGLLISAGIAAIAMLVACIFRAIELQRHDDTWNNWNWYFTIMGCVYTGCMGISLGPMGLAYFSIMFTAKTLDRRMSTAESTSDCQNCSCTTFASMCCAPLCGVHRSLHPFGAGRGYFSCQ
mmetsp:Transcript_20096/g.52176  ORF Transcript_20096/g.52176 Transcript_20096/m.52176 type:complete len:336 (+) Transcript_20096:251-1258(+)